jgi:hypothetical protein
VPAGFAHGFCTLTPDCEVFYKVNSPYSQPHYSGVAFDDPDIAIDWPVDIATAILSDKDRCHRRPYGDPPASGPTKSCTWRRKAMSTARSPANATFAIARSL